LRLAGLSKTEDNTFEDVPKRKDIEINSYSCLQFAHFNSVQVPVSVILVQAIKG
jgi:hypothetical protein